MNHKDSNIKRLRDFEGGYILPSGKLLTVEIANDIGKSVGLQPPTGNYEIDNNRVKIEDELGSYYGLVIPQFIPHIIHNNPKPPMLLFLNRDVASLNMCPYVINLNTMRPTAPSKIQSPISGEILSRLKY